MAFTIGWEGNSLVGVAYADQRFADRGVTAWAGDVSAKQGALVRATDYVRALFLPRMDPDKVNEAFYLLGVPDALFAAVAEYALVELVTPGGLAPAAPAQPTTVVTKEKVGPLETSYTLVAGTAPTPGARRLFPVADALIARLLLPSAGLSRTIR